MGIRLFRLAATVGVVLAGVVMAPPVHHASATSRSSQQAPDVLRITPGQVTRTIPDAYFGINYVAFWSKTEGSAATAAALAQTPIKTVRFPGGAPADWYDWQQPYYKGWSNTSPSDLWRYARSFGACHVLFQTNVHNGVCAIQCGRDQVGDL